MRCQCTQRIHQFATLYVEGSERHTPTSPRCSCLAPLHRDGPPAHVPGGRPVGHRSQLPVLPHHQAGGSDHAQGGRAPGRRRAAVALALCGSHLGGAVYLACPALQHPCRVLSWPGCLLPAPLTLTTELLPRWCGRAHYLGHNASQVLAAVRGPLIVVSGIILFSEKVGPMQVLS